jgi:predicted Rossmann fold flavoprotein
VSERFEVVIIGGGAAGLFCAIEAGRRRRKVLVLERNAQVGRKIIISGGGRCNFTNLNTSPENFVSKNPHFAKSALARYTPSDLIGLVRKHRIEYYEKKLGQLFCKESSRQIVDMLLTECSNERVDVKTGCSVNAIDRDKGFRLETSIGDIPCDSLVIATGGLSFPKIGASDFGYRIARQFGLSIEPTRPSLVPLIFRDQASGSKLAGISIDSAVSPDGPTFHENVLFTHRGLSGPAILQASNYWNKDAPMTIDLLPGQSVAELLETHRESRQTVSTFLGRMLPKNFVSSAIRPDLAARQLTQVSNKDVAELTSLLNEWSVYFKDTEGWDKAEVTAGGVSTSELSSQTMESKRIPGLYFVGEVVDVTGWLGGYNFQWAWASGYAAGQVV